MVVERARVAGTTVEEIERRLVGPVTIGRLLDAREVAYVVAFLVSPKAAAINGDAISVGVGIGGRSTTRRVENALSLQAPLHS
jgi:NAD(P)-dependent dehydrogenase (short-subunit alcohol dehydrogenase family)